MYIEQAGILDAPKSIFDWITSGLSLDAEKRCTNLHPSKAPGKTLRPSDLAVFAACVNDPATKAYVSKRKRGAYLAIGGAALGALLVAKLVF